MDDVVFVVSYGAGAQTPGRGGGLATLPEGGAAVSYCERAA
jgi:hypothetical protein